MSTQPSEIVQSGKTIHWEEIRDSRLEEHHDISEGRKLWRPVDYLLRTRRLHRLDEFIVRATTIIDESREADRTLKGREQSLSEQPAPLITETSQSHSSTSGAFKQPEIA